MDDPRQFGDEHVPEQGGQGREPNPLLEISVGSRRRQGSTRGRAAGEHDDLRVGDGLADPRERPAGGAGHQQVSVD
ncbi:MAG: hypothetical protein ACRDG2_02100, partial [Actinomycetota bacterium]